ncbi:hypothetical protein Pst134EA_013371 [Puccinia striiformis f. sp. tritici]|uniref:hypothetical protein n=1 Tax=Puccinia striiformis f. sp. tritici TaxID=168172 RepID=UPI002007E95D|nr:hypothetical protein Pst134EA_013371 [Puccinia striiformis f. sp. tritici]KAH9465490.1 hypothetical protein Pst134EA_013371 [Puccinia striiformis f. sp. tritici]
MAPESATTFEDVRFTVGPISGDYVFILGRPSLTTFDIWVSLKNRQIVNRRSALPIFDYRVGASSNTCAVSALLIPYPCTTMESTILAEYSDIFPPDIPAVADGADDRTHFPDIPFPEKAQLPSSSIHHRIVLTGHNAVINEWQYP